VIAPHAAAAIAERHRATDGIRDARLCCGAKQSAPQENRHDTDHPKTHFSIVRARLRLGRDGFAGARPVD
jgi:hypothetical protein